MSISDLIDLALEEDFGRGDVTSTAIFAADARAQGTVLAKDALVVCGLDVMAEVFRRVDATVEFTALVAEGTAVAKGTVVARVSGPTRALLSGERTALNFLQRMSGVATLTRKYVDAISGTRAMVCDTRKTIPGWRTLDKRAVAAGGGANHRADLASGVLIKDNHIAACGSVRAAVERARKVAPHTLRIEVEVTALAQIDDALAAGAEIVLLDNMTPSDVKKCVEHIAGRALVEVSGGVTLETIGAYAAAGPDRISVGALTHSARAVDLSLEIA